ncbi:MAG: DDE-type integrase/transposase/recombinase [Clostridiales bacterium]|jgi:transposase InsO family protein|nr:DDE-type integrase/transposase/recombinase [Clostridiales bacterium]
MQLFVVTVSSITQYTMLNEATRERFIYPYTEHCGDSTADFIKRAIVYFGYIPAIIQTDNGSEFTDPKRKGTGKKQHIADVTMQKLKIEHQLIKPRTPRHNGKVERSHRNDQSRFYKYLRFETFEELQQKMSEYLTRSNNIPTSVFKSKNKKGRIAWLSPLQKRAELFARLKADTEFSVRFVEQAAA